MQDRAKTRGQLIDELVQMRQRIAELQASKAERKRAEEALLRHVRREEMLHAVAAAVSQTLDLEEMLDCALNKVIEVMEMDAGGIYLLDETAREIVLKAHRGVSEEYVAEVHRLKLESEEFDRVMAWKEPLLAMGERPTPEIAKVFNQRKLARIVAAIAKEGQQSRIIVPIRSKATLLGGLVTCSRHPRQLTSEDIEVLQSIADQLAVGIENSELFAKVSHSATIDGLTGLCNYRYFQERLEEEVARVLRFGGECSVIMFDLDHFKVYNDRFGHIAGDEALIRVGEVLRDHTRQVDLACRYGGEEFTVILPQTNPADAYEVAERLRRLVQTALSQKYGTLAVSLTISVGVASCPSDGVSREALTHRCDLAMREAKQRGRNQTCVASDVLGAAPAGGVVGWEIAEHLEARGLNAVYALAAAVDARDHYTYAHSRNVAKYTLALGKALRLSRRKQERLRVAALLHDIGKLGLSDSMIQKAGPLDEKEWESMRKHPELGATIISHTPELADCAPAIRHHHEWYDDSGYPDGLKGEGIPLESRIIAIADAYDTMTTPRAYRQTLSPKEALSELRRCADSQFDPHLVETFGRAVGVLT